MTTVGGASAAAAVTGIMGSSVGAAALIAGFGAGGAHVVGGKMARRVGQFASMLQMRPSIIFAGKYDITIRMISL